MDQGKAYYGPDGTLYVWTGTGYHPIPKIAASDVGAVRRDEDVWSQGDNPYLIQAARDLYGINDPTKYGLPNDLFAQFSLQGDNSQDAFNYWLKSGDKEGSEIGFTKEGDYYVPKFAGLQSWDTNDADKRVVPLSILLGGGALVASGAGAAGAAAGAAGGESGGLLGAMNPYDAALMAGGEPIAGSGFSGAASGTTAFGQPFTAGATLSGAGEAAGSLYGLPNMTGVPGALGGGAFAGVNPADLNAPTLGGGGNNYTAPPSGSSPSGSTPSGSTPSVSDALKGLSMSDIIKAAMAVGGGLLGSNAGGGSAERPPAVVPKTIPKMYGEGGMIGNYGPMGPTETERRMRKEYMPGLLGGKNPWGY